MNDGRICRCESCDREIEAIQSFDENTPPRCSCGALLKKPYQKPAVRKMTVETEIFAVAKTNRN
jgi:hypothetical protein